MEERAARAAGRKEAKVAKAARAKARTRAAKAARVQAHGTPSLPMAAPSALNGTTVAKAARVLAAAFIAAGLACGRVHCCRACFGKHPVHMCKPRAAETPVVDKTVLEV